MLSETGGDGDRDHRLTAGEARRQGEVTGDETERLLLGLPTRRGDRQPWSPPWPTILGSGNLNTMFQESAWRDRRTRRCLDWW